MKTPEEIVALYRSRQKSSGPQREQMRDILNLYQGDIAVPLPEMRRDEKAAVVNLAKQGINQMGMRAASVMPNMAFPPINTGRQTDARARADDRRKVAMSWWDEEGMNIKMRQRGRWLFAYAHSPTLVLPNFKEGRPMWRPTSPLDTYPAHLSSFDDMVPCDSVVSAIHSVGYCKYNWSDATLMVLRDMKDDALCEVLHFIDADEYHMVVTPRLMNEEVQVGAWGTSKALRAATLEWHPNLTGVPWLVMARSISLERPVGLYDGIIGMYEAQAELEALSRIARRKGVFWEEWLIAENSQTVPTITVRADPYNGQVGIVSGGKLERLSPEVQYATDTGVDRLERSQRIEAGLPSDFGGEAGSNIRTGARATALIQSAVDPVLQEAHELFARSLEHENHIAIAIDKSYWSGRSKTIYLGDEVVAYDPGKTWETDRHKVDYSMAGADLNQMTIVPLQMKGAGMMSTRTAMNLHPLIKNVEKEMDAIVVDRIDDAILMSLQTLLTTPGGIPLGDAIKIRNMVANNQADLGEAYNKVQLEAQERQAKMAETQAQTMPGIEMPGQGAEQPPAIPQAAPSMENLRNILGNARMQAMQTPQERGVA